jgi:phage terminase large subunit GpA-like protein
VKKGKVRLFLVGVDTAKRDVYARLRIREPGPGYCHFPKTRGHDYFRMLTAETLKVRYHRGHPTYYWYLPPGRRNEALDCRAYAYAALHGYYSQGLNLDAAVDRIEQARKNDHVLHHTSSADSRKTSTQRGWLGGRRKGWL